MGVMRDVLVQAVWSEIQARGGCRSSIRGGSCGLRWQERKGKNRVGQASAFISWARESQVMSMNRRDAGAPSPVTSCCMETATAVTALAPASGGSSVTRSQLLKLRKKPRSRKQSREVIDRSNLWQRSSEQLLYQWLRYSLACIAGHTPPEWAV